MAKRSQNEVRAEFNILRAEAINAYSGVEHAMTVLLKELLKSEYRVAGLIFSKMVNTKSRNQTLSELLKYQFDNKYKEFRITLFKEMTKLDTTRHKIVHWQSWIAKDTTQKLFAYLKHPHSVHKGEKITKDDLFEFHRDAAFIEQALISLNWDLFSPVSMRDQALQQIFLQPIIRPIPKSHPFLYNYRAPQAQP